MMLSLNREFIIHKLKKLKYDIKSYSKELDALHNDWNYPNYDGPIYYQGYDEFENYHEEDIEHKKWRLNHNKKYYTIKMTMTVMPKKIDTLFYMLDDNSLNEIVDKLSSQTIYSITC